MRLLPFLFFILSSPLFAHAERLIVMMKDKASFQRLHKQQGTWSQEIPGKIEASLQNINTFIVDTANPRDVERLRSIQGVAYIEKEYLHPAPRKFVQGAALQAAASTPLERPWGLDAIHAPEAWSLTNKGEGARILILDSGLQSNHPSIQPNFEKGRDFTGAGDDSDFSDNTGHGTHVAGTAAAAEMSGGFAGVAPKAKILAGRVCREEGCWNTAVVAGINWGIEEKVDVVNLSLGSYGPTPAETAAVLSADRAGVSLVAATGNYGTAEVLFPAAHPTVIAVGAVDKNLRHAFFSQYGPEVSVVAPGVDVLSSIPVGTGRESSILISATNETEEAVLFHGTTVPRSVLTKPLVYCGDGLPEDFQGKDVTGKHVLLMRSDDLYFTEQIRNAMRAGALSVLIINNTTGITDTTLFEKENMLFATAFLLSQETGAKILSLLETTPDIQISMRTKITDYKETFGTSMASPHVAGVVALMKVANKNLLPTEIKSILMKTALPLGPNKENKYGAGLINAKAAVVAALALRNEKK
ncbi:S8 family serine peptidase [Bdellovibrio bacteriovorus]|uniref:S8 family serine peptidase n=1 Tax=Bdellovibrio bacteriovorus TaxID=959 RepID=UPI0035A5B520